MLRAGLFVAVYSVLVPSLALASIESLATSIETAPLGVAGSSSTEYSIGHFRLEFGRDELYPLLVDGMVVGAFAPGGGRFEYASDEPYETEGFAVNVRRLTRYKLEDRGVREAFSAALILDSSLAALFPEEERKQGLAPETAQKALAKFRRRFADDRGVEPVNLLAQALLEGSSLRVSCVLIQAGEDLVYRYDELRSLEESLEVIERFPSGTYLSGKRYPSTLSRQPISGHVLDPRPARWVIRAVDVDLLNPKDQELRLTVRETVEANVRTRTLAFSLWDHVYDSEVFDYKLLSIATADGKSVSYVRKHRNLVVELSEPLEAGARIELQFQLAGDTLIRPGGHSFWWLPLSSWLPLPPRWDMRSFTYHGVVRTAKPFVPYSMGTTVRRWDEDGLSCAEFKLDRPVQFAVILAGKYNTYLESRDGLEVTVSSYVFKRNESMERIANNVFELIAFFEKVLGDFPFDELNIIEINSYGFGVAPPGVIYLTREAFDPGPEGRRYREELNHRMAHEVAHQWWGHVAQMASPREQWLSESTAEYYGALAIGSLLGESKFKAATRSWKEQAGNLTSFESIYYANRIEGDKAGLERYCLLYGSGPLMLHELREELGDQVFLTIFKSLLTNFPYKHVDTGTLIKLTNYITEKDYYPWFEERLFGGQ